MEISIAEIRVLRDQTGAGIMECRKALVEAGGDNQKAIQILKEKSLVVGQKRAGRATKQGLVEAYIHAGGRIGALIELDCETDFVARTDEFKELAHEMAMQVAALAPRFISPEEIPEGSEAKPEVTCLLLQPYIRNPEMTVKDVIVQMVAKFDENIRVSRFARFEIGV